MAEHVNLPALIQTETELEELLGEPTPPVVDALARLPGDVIVLGVSGKMGKSLARMAALTRRVAPGRLHCSR